MPGTIYYGFGMPQTIYGSLDTMGPLLAGEPYRGYGADRFLVKKQNTIRDAEQDNDAQDEPAEPFCQAFDLHHGRNIEAHEAKRYSSSEGTYGLVAGLAEPTMVRRPSSLEDRRGVEMRTFFFRIT